MEFKFKLIILLLISNVSLQCSKGCLKCLDENICYLCDNVNFYFLKNNKCILNEIQQCIQYTQFGQCEQCDSQSYLIQKEECGLIYDEIKIEGCQEYINIRECRKCSLNMDVVEGKCQIKTNVIENCFVYNSTDNTLCEQCIDGFKISDDKLNCQEITPAQNCAVSSRYKCVRCKNGYRFDPNFYFSQIFDFSNSKNSNQIFDFRYAVKKSKFSDIRFPICFVEDLENCSQIDQNNPENCSVCNHGFYLENGKCFKFPQEPIPNCRKYLSENQCSDCKENYFLQTGTECVPVTQVEHCLTYETSQNVSACKKCESIFYLNNGLCVERINSLNIKNCIQVSKTEDLCQECMQEYLLETQKTECLKGVPNCLTYQPGTNQCSQCKENFFMVGQMCILGTKLNCKIYEVNSNTCLQCEYGYYLQGQYCYRHKHINRCSQYHHSNKDFCVQCQAPSLIYQVSNICMKMMPISNCKEHGQDNNGLYCINCEDGFAYNETDKNCLYFNDQYCLTLRLVNQVLRCVKCKENTFLSKNGKCLMPPNYLSKNCERLTKNLIDSADIYEIPECEVCLEKFYPFKFNKMEICLENTFDTVQLIERCEVYELVSNQPLTFSCLECQSNMYYELSTKSCHFKCDSVHSILQLSFDTNNNTTQKKQLNECLPLTSQQTYPKCEKIMQISESNSEQYKCVQCAPDTRKNYRIPVIINDGTSHLTHIAYFSRQNNIGQELNPLVKQQFVNCPETANITVVYFNELENNEIVPNCELFSFQTGSHDVTDPNTQVTTTINYDLYQCQRCSIGYTGQAKNGFIKNCSVRILACSSVEIGNFLSPYLNGLDQTNNIPLSNYAGCFKCSQNKIPVLFLNSNLVFEEFTWNTVPGYVSQCLDKTPESFELAVDTDITSIVENCAQVLYFVNQQTISAVNTDVNKTIFCSACLPGYKPIYTDGKISQCEEIQNCKINYYFSGLKFYNYCHQCNDGFQYHFNMQTKTFDYTICEQIPSDEKCEIFDSVNIKCFQCKQNYWKNIDGDCEPQTIPLCTSMLNSTFSYDNNLSYNIYRASLGHGCNQCSASTIKLLSPHSICIQTAAEPQSLPTNFILNCLKYKTNDIPGLKCEFCKEGFVVSQDHTQCFENSSLKNCQEALSITQCNICEKKYVPISHQCESESIENCDSFENNPQQTTQQCLTCSEGYYIDQGKCVEGKIQGCKSYQNVSLCQECYQNYNLVVLSGNSYCYPIPAQYNCKNFDGQFSAGILNCMECKVQYSQNNNLVSFDNQICLEGQVIPHCENYDIQTTLNNSNMNCIQCQEDYYLFENNCLKRNFKDNFCQRFSANQDECLECHDDYYVSQDRKQCIVNPQGIFGCLLYESKTLCSLCKENFYLSEGICIFLLAEQIIENCQAYDSQKNCILCKNNFYLNGNSCVQVNALNCLTYKNENACEKCLDNQHGLKIENELTNCVLKNVSNCILSTDVEPFECQICQTGFFAEQGVCQTVQTQIQNCEIYDSTSTCQICQENYILNLKKDSCIQYSNQFPKNDEFCYSYQEVAEGHCEVCQLGWYFSPEGQCQKCQQNTNEEGCMSCNPKDETQCLMCDDGFYQKSKDEKCNLLVEPIPEIYQSKIGILNFGIIFLYFFYQIILNKKSFLIFNNDYYIVFK